MREHHEEFNVRRGGGRVKGDVRISSDGRIVLNTETESRNDLFGWKGYAWLEIYDTRGFHIYTTERLSIWANARIVGRNDKVSKSITENMSSEITQIADTLDADLIVTDRNDSAINGFKIAVRDAKEGLEELKDAFGEAFG